MTCRQRIEELSLNNGQFKFPGNTMYGGPDEKEVGEVIKGWEIFLIKIFLDVMGLSPTQVNFILKNFLK